MFNALKNVEIYLFYFINTNISGGFYVALKLYLKVKQS